MVQIEPRKDFPKELQVGMQFEGGPEEGEDDDFVIYRVTDIADDKVVLDGNHPLAARIAVTVQVKTSAMPASGEELEHGHVHTGDDDEETHH
jgi:FKBP-type peptidyl-prolyl cis-trans isomerase SlyD